MNCRLCNEKIPRMRALFKKSEFCCDEHAEQYKDQTLDRLLTEAEQPAGAVAPLPLPPPGDRPLASLESRTPLLEGQTVHGGPRRLAPSKSVTSNPQGRRDFDGLLDRLPVKKPAALPAGGIGGWDQAGGEDPLQALLRLESAAQAPPARLAPPSTATPAGFDSPLATPPSSEEDAISALRRLAEEARQSALRKAAPEPAPLAAAEDPFARLAAGQWDKPQPSAAEDLWARQDGPQFAAGEPPEGNGVEAFTPDGLEGDDARPDGEATGGLSVFDRLVRDFNSDSRSAPADSLDPSARPLPAISRPAAAEAPHSEGSPEEEDAPFAGSMFDRLMADPPRPKPPKAVEPLPAAMAAQAGPDSSASTGQDEWIESPFAAETEQAGAADRDGNATHASAAAPVEHEDTESPPSPAASRQAQQLLPAPRARGREAAPIAARTELLELAAAGWPAENESTGDSESLERLFAEQRASEAALHAPRPPAILEPARINVPVREAIPTAAARSHGNAGVIPWQPRLQPAAIAPPAGTAIDPAHAWQPRGETIGPLPACTAPQMPGVPGANGHSPERFWDLSIAGRVLEIAPPQPGPMPPSGAPAPALECLPAKAGLSQPQPLLECAAANGRGAHCSPRLELAEALPVSALADEPFLVGRHPLALAPSAPVRLPATGQHGNPASTGTATLPGAVAGLVGAEPRGTPFETAGLEQMRRLVAEQTATAVGGNGAAGLGWSPSLASEPFHPSLIFENSGRG